MAKQVVPFKKSWVYGFFTLVFLPILLAVGFQNCGKAGFETAPQNNTALEVAASQNDPTPFGFEAAIDQISYLSCASAASAGKAFSFKAGAYQVQPGTGTNPADVMLSGIRVKRDYINWAKANLQPEFDPNNPNNHELTLAQAKQYLASSKKNDKAQLQFSMRQLKDLRNIYSKDKQATYGIDIVPMAGLLTDDRWLAPLMSKSFTAKSDAEYTNFFPMAESNSTAILEAALDFNTSANSNSAYENSSAFRKEFDSNAVLVLGYDNIDDEKTLRAPAGSPVSAAYGLAYRLNFQAGLTAGFPGIASKAEITPDKGPASPAVSPVVYVSSSAPNSSNPRLILKDVTNEVNLETGKPTGRTWDCSVSRRYTVVRNDSLRDFYCPKMTYPQTVGNLAELAIVRRHFPASDWDVNIPNRCIVPKKFSCYQDEKFTGIGSVDGIVAVEYDLRNPCYYNTAELLQTFPGNKPPTKYCAEVASICIRN